MKSCFHLLLRPVIPKVLVQVIYPLLQTLIVWPCPLRVFQRLPINPALELSFLALGPHPHLTHKGITTGLVPPQPRVPVSRAGSADIVNPDARAQLIIRI